MRSGQNSRPARRPEYWQSVCSVSDASAVGPRFSCSRLLAASLKLASLACLAVAISGCAQDQRRAYGGRSGGKEYFAEGKYGKASPRVVLMGEDVPKGGGRYLVGRPYRIAGRTYVPSEKQAGYTVTGTASWYGAAFHGRRTANGEIYDMASITAAHPTMPLPSYARVTNLKNGKSIVVRVNDRGPYHGGRVMDMSSRVADLLEFKGAGTARVKVDYLGKAGLGGSDDRQLAATLTTGAPAQLAGYETPAAEPPVAVAAPAPQETAPEPRRRSARPAPAPPAVETRGPEEEAPLAAEPSAPAPAPQKPRRQRSSKPTVLDPEPDAQEAVAQESATSAPEPSDAAPQDAPTPPRRPTGLRASADDDEEPGASVRARAAVAGADDVATPKARARKAASAALEDEETPKPRARAVVAGADEIATPKARARKAAASALEDDDAPDATPRPAQRARVRENGPAFYFSPDMRLATRLAAPMQPFFRLRDDAAAGGAR